MIKDKIKDFVIETFLKRLMDEVKSALIKVPLFASGPLHSVALFVVEKVLVFVIRKTSLKLYIWKLHLETSAEVGRVNELAEKYELEGDKMTTEQLKELDRELENAIYDLIEFNSDRLR